MGVINFSWQAPTERADGSALNNPVTYNLYLNGELYIEEIGALNFTTTDIDQTGLLNFQVTAFDTVTRTESLPSETVTVNFTPPASPTGFTYSVSG